MWIKEGGGGKILKNIKHGGKNPSFKIGEAKSIINQNRGGKIPSFKIGRAKSKFNQNMGGKTALKPKKKVSCNLGCINRGECTW